MTALKENTAAPAAPAAPAAAPQAANQGEFLALEAEATMMAGEADPALAALQAHQAQQAAEGVAQWAALVAQLGKPATDIIAPGWRVSQEEWTALGQAWAPILQQYFPEATDLGPWPGAILCTALIVAPRIGRPMREAPADPGQDDDQDEADDRG